ncbi:hypothetical protein CHCC5024_3919 [Bacillus licheniformis]|nr:N-acetylmuramoyl-L-alanine amidase [Bacillus licheniformis]TWJ49048.1 hypothetical protein CHCC5024_3919 [Bacillus licheniformis]TWJ85558.1 hypothetical protein CHCC20495_0374 [Bacillus licheniformis]TWL42331.1 hypothetical protein CHCC15543_4160 [Bacillus licheniformis]TWL53109.1 hypothetical protein CHCC15335_0017 [Bacillus licheniformis]
MKGTAVRQIQEALAALYFYPDKGAKNNGIGGYYGRKRRTRSNGSSLCTGFLPTVFTDRKRKQNSNPY